MCLLHIYTYYIHIGWTLGGNPCVYYSGLNSYRKRRFSFFFFSGLRSHGDHRHHHELTRRVPTLNSISIFDVTRQSFTLTDNPNSSRKRRFFSFFFFSGLRPDGDHRHHRHRAHERQFDQVRWPAPGEPSTVPISSIFLQPGTHPRG